MKIEYHKSISFHSATQLLKYTDKNLSVDEITRKIDEVINCGRALEKFREMLIYQGVDKELAGKLCVHEMLSIDDYLKILNRKSNRVTEIGAHYRGIVQINLKYF